MKKLLFIAVCCLLLCGCEKEKITICTDDYSKTTIRHKGNKITFIKYETFDKFNTVNEAIEQETKMNNILKENEKSRNRDKDFVWHVERNDKMVIVIQETYRYNKPYLEELKYIESLQNYICSEQ